MALDHYVSQVHLKRFYAPTLDGKKMYAFRKSDAQTFICGSKDICRNPEGNTNSYLAEPRLVEDFLRMIEPKYNAACAAFTEDKITPDAVFVIAGFVAYVMSCSPAGLRLQTSPLHERLALEAEMLDRAGQIPKSPPALDEKTLSELLADGSVVFDIDEKYPQAVGITNLINSVSAYRNFHWDILVNEHVNTPFLTSDFPVAVEQSRDIRIVNRIVPLTPWLAIRMCPRVELSSRKLNPTFEHFSYQQCRPSRSEIVGLNRAIARCAENLVFSSISQPRIAEFIRKNAQFRIEIETTNIPHGTGFINITRTIVREQGT